jgi:hypothetical protein
MGRRQELALVAALLLLPLGCQDTPTTEGEVGPGTPAEADLDEGTDTTDGVDEGTEP